MGISESIWGDAYLARGREQAAIAVSIASAKLPGWPSERPALSDGALDAACRGLAVRSISVRPRLRRIALTGMMKLYR
jgi:hypothetical protein